MSLEWVRPRGLRPGDRIGVCAPSGPVDMERLARGVRRLEAAGFEAYVPEGVGERTLFTAGSIERRLEELHGLVGDPDIAAIVCARGGAGATQLLHHLDAELIAKHPKPLLGSSDATCLHLLLARLGVVSFHGPMVSMDLARDDCDASVALAPLTSGSSGLSFEGPRLRTLRKGRGEGRLVGGCLALLAAMAGTPWALESGDELILFVEDVNEAPFRLDRMLRQLIDSRALTRVRGVVFGEMLRCEPPTGAEYTLADVLLDALRELNVPVAFGLPSGHTEGPGMTVPLGVRARLECGESTRLEMLEPAVT